MIDEKSLLETESTEKSEEIVRNLKNGIEKGNKKI
mgnify:CR=1 FL=1